MNTHTPGPWAVRPITHVVGPSYGITKGEGDTWIARCHPLNGENAEEVKANAQLMAAAPDLLSAAHDAADLIEELVSDLFTGTDGDTAVERTVRALRDAMRKARGES